MGARWRRQIAGLDLGQMVVVRDRACVAIEAMEGTDETIERAARITGGQRLVVVKVSKPQQDMRFDVPVVGLKTIEVMKRSNATALAIDAGRTLLFDRDALIRAADDAGIAIEAFAPEDSAPHSWRLSAQESCRSKRKCVNAEVRHTRCGGRRRRVWTQPRPGLGGNGRRGTRRHRGHQRRTRARRSRRNSTRA